MSGNRPTALCCIIAGPTGVGKTAVALELARRWRSEVISADSMQVYRRLRIGTATPSREETGSIPYHLIDFLDPLGPEGAERRFSAAEFVRLARPIIDRLLGDNRPPVIAGGTGLYLRALTLGLFTHAPIPVAERAALERELAPLPSPEIHRRLAEIDPETAGRIHPNDRIRLVRAMEIIRATGATPSDLRALQAARPDASIDSLPADRYAYFILNASRRDLYERINRRVEGMFAAGLAGETRSLLAAGVQPHMHCMKALGYAHVAAYLRGELTQGQALAAVQQSHRNYAKRQLTWFRKVRGARWISTADKSPQQIADEIENCLASRPPELPYSSARLR